MSKAEILPVWSLTERPVSRARRVEFFPIPLRVWLGCAQLRASTDHSFLSPFEEPAGAARFCRRNGGSSETQRGWKAETDRVREGISDGSAWLSPRGSFREVMSARVLPGSTPSL